MFDICNEDGSSAGYQASRTEAHQKGLWHKTVHVWIGNRNGELLLQKRSMSKEVFPGCWDVSCAGHIDSGESNVEAAIRELHEELGISASQNELMYLFSMVQQFTISHKFIIDNEIADVFLLKRKIEYVDVCVGKDEVTGVRFVNSSDLIEGKITELPEIAQRNEEYAKLLDYLTTHT